MPPFEPDVVVTLCRLAVAVTQELETLKALRAAHEEALAEVHAEALAEVHAEALAEVHAEALAEVHAEALAGFWTTTPDVGAAIDDTRKAPPQESFTSYVFRAIDHACVRANVLSEQVDQLLSTVHAAVDLSDAAVDSPVKLAAVKLAAFDTLRITGIEDSIDMLTESVQRLQAAAACFEQRLRERLAVPSADDDALLLDLFVDAHSKRDCGLFALCAVHPRCLGALRLFSHGSTGDGPRCCSFRCYVDVLLYLDKQRKGSSFFMDFYCAFYAFMMDSYNADAEDHADCTHGKPKLVSILSEDSPGIDVVLAFPRYRFNLLDCTARTKDGDTVLAVLVNQCVVATAGDAYKRCRERVCKLLQLPVMATQNVNAFNAGGLTALALATRCHDDGELVRVLLKCPDAARIDVNAGYGDNVPLLCAMDARNYGAMSALLGHRDKLRQWWKQDLRFGTSLAKALTLLPDTRAVTLLVDPDHAACHAHYQTRYGFYGDDDVVTLACLALDNWRLLGQVDITPLIKAAWDRGEKPFHNKCGLLRVAMRNQHTWMARYALRDMAAGDSFAAAREAMRKGSLGVFKEILDASDFDVNACAPTEKAYPRESHKTLLVIAAEWDAEPFVRALLDLPEVRGLNVSVKDRRGKCALDVAWGKSRELLDQRGFFRVPPVPPVPPVPDVEGERCCTVS